MDTKHEDWPALLLERWKFFGATVVCLLIDGVFLLIWLGIHWTLQYAFNRINLSGVEKIVTSLLKLILEIPLFLTVIIFIIADVRKVAQRVFSGARKELQIGK